jgi:hypothetical protein
MKQSAPLPAEQARASQTRDVTFPFWNENLKKIQAVSIGYC